jgi:hypothetical protein
VVTRAPRRAVVLPPMRHPASRGKLVISPIAAQPEEAVRYRVDVAVGLARRIDEMLLSLIPLSATFGYLPGPRVAIFVPLKSSSSKNSQVPDRMTIDEDRAHM